MTRFLFYGVFIMNLKNNLKSRKAQSAIEYLGVTIVIFLALLTVNLVSSMSPTNPYGGIVIDAFRATTDRVMSGVFGAIVSNASLSQLPDYDIVRPVVYSGDEGYLAPDVPIPPELNPGT